MSEATSSRLLVIALYSIREERIVMQVDVDAAAVASLQPSILRSFGPRPTSPPRPSNSNSLVRVHPLAL